MRCCEFCHDEFESRPQVKKPRACGKPECQRLRQRANERTWHERNPMYSDAKYHEDQRRLRKSRIQRLAVTLQRCLQVGRDLLGLTLAADKFAEILEVFLLRLGVRQINKFWPEENVPELSPLGQASK